MLLIEQPSITLVAKSVPTVDAVHLVPDHDNHADIIAAVGGKVCYDAHGKDGRPVDAHVQRLVQSHHFSVLEHVTYSFLITGISRGLSHELVRHRHLSFSQRSTRYTEEGDERVVLEPRVLQLRDADPDAFNKYINALSWSFTSYNRAVEDFSALAPADLSATERRKYARGAARQLLPNALETQMVVTGNLRTWREILLLRTSRHAEAEIRRLFTAIWEWFEGDGGRPMAFFGLRAEIVDGFVELTDG